MIKAKIKKDDLKIIFDILKDSHKIIGPKIANDVVTLSEIDFNDIPSGYIDSQNPGSYRLNRGGPNRIFSFSIGPESFKRFLHPPEKDIFAFKESKSGITISHPSNEEKPAAFIGMRACDISGLKLLDKVFLEGPVRDAAYDSVRRNSIVIGINCIHPHNNCFCASMGAGPELKDSFDMALTELDDSFLIETCTPKGNAILKGLTTEEARTKDLNEKAQKMEECKKTMKKSVKASDLPWLIYRNLEHPEWNDVASRCLACGNCTQVCPTCFCNSTFDCLQISGFNKKSSAVSGIRVRTWDSCFSKNFARVHGGNFRASRKARYRQWLSHKMAYWIDQFGSPGCVGCGRCITWCPVGIDITEELEALRHAR